MSQGAGPSPFDLPVVFQVGPIPVTRPVVVTWGLMTVLAVASRLLTSRLRLRPGRAQTAVELLVTTIENQLAEVIPDEGRDYLWLLGTMFLFLFLANASGLVPGIQAPTAHLETPAALAVVVFLSVHVAGLRRHGLLGYLREFTKPSIFLLPLNLLSEVTRTFSLMIRLFGNVMSGEFIIAIVLGLAGLLVPIPLMGLELLTGLIQAYIFTTLAAVFIAAAIGTTSPDTDNGKEPTT
ncbi:MAG TPA: F0F1 ATP synthase subunit A [Polyangia bacterium]|nr:F0F1 ATP synthase subunit A [Polyangia bacterium]